MGNKEGYRADGRIFKTKAEADNVNAHYDLQHLLDMVHNRGMTTEELADKMKDFKKEFAEIFTVLSTTKGQF